MTEILKCDYCNKLIEIPNSGLARLTMPSTWILKEKHCFGETDKDFCNLLCACKYLIKRCEEIANKVEENTQSPQVCDKSEKGSSCLLEDTQSPQKYAPKNLDAMREKKCSRSEPVGVGLQNDKPVNDSENQTEDTHIKQELNKEISKDYG